MLAPYFSLHTDDKRACRTCRYAISARDGWHLWCEKHRLVLVFPCGWWKREAGCDPPWANEVALSPALRLAQGK